VVGLPAELALRPGKPVRLEPIGAPAAVAEVVAGRVRLVGGGWGEAAEIAGVSCRVVAQRAWLEADLREEVPGVLVGWVGEAWSWNARHGPRAPLRAPGTYFLRGLAVGVPMTVLDVSVTGIAVVPIPEVVDPPGTVRAVAVEVGGRLVRAAAELVERDEDRWRLRFVRLAPGDEAVIARWVFARQVLDRAVLGNAADATASLDASAQRAHPAVELSLGPGGLAARIVGCTEARIAVALPTPSPEDASVFERWWRLVGPWVRIGDPEDLAWLARGLPGVVAGAVVAAYAQLAAVWGARAHGCSGRGATQPALVDPGSGGEEET